MERSIKGKEEHARVVWLGCEQVSKTGTLTGATVQEYIGKKHTLHNQLEMHGQHCERQERATCRLGITYWSIKSGSLRILHNVYIIIHP